jgi:hypothetical protein
MNLNQIKEIALDIITDPARGWEKHRHDFLNEQHVLKGYALPLMLLAAAATVLKLGVFQGNPSAGVIVALIQIVVGIASLYVVSFVVNFLASKFDGTPSSSDAFTFVAFSNTAGWIGGVLSVVPIIGWLASMALWLYGFYISYKGIGPCLNVPQAKQMTFFIVMVLAIIVVSFVVSALIGALTFAVIGSAMIAPGLG